MMILSLISKNTIVLVTVTFKRLKKYVIFFKSETHIHVIFIDGKISILVIKLSIGMYLILFEISKRKKKLRWKLLIVPFSRYFMQSLYLTIHCIHVYSVIHL